MTHYRYLVVRANQELLQLAVRHFVGRDFQGSGAKGSSVFAKNHAAPQLFARLSKVKGFAKRSKARGEILERLSGEVCVGVLSEQRTVDPALLKIEKDSPHLFPLASRGGIRRRQHERRDLPGDG